LWNCTANFRPHRLLALSTAVLLPMFNHLSNTAFLNFLCHANDTQGSRRPCGLPQSTQKIADACGPPLEAAYAFAAGADAGQAAATRPAFILK
jgi:hypothetical protein